MDNRLPQPKAKGKPSVSSGKVLNDTKMASDTATPDENDPLWKQLGATRLAASKSDLSGSGVGPESPTNHTELSPSRVLGKNVMILGEYQLLRKLGEGAMGAVYKALQVSFNGEKLEKPRTVALKILFPHVANNPKLVKRLRREAEVMFQLDHPNIVQAFAVGEAEGCHFVAMEYIPGQSAQKWLTQIERMSVADSLRVTLDCAKALAYAHSMDVIHRDIKPDNILLTRDGKVKVADLGMVKIDDEEMSLTQTGHAVGTPWYMPIEQARNAKEIDGRSDIYALGCTLYAFITGRPPFTGRTIVDVIEAKELGTFPPARQSNSDVPERLDLIIAKMVAKQPKYRYQNCTELIKDLEGLNLASPVPTFVKTKRVGNDSDESAFAKMKATIDTTLMKSKTEPTDLAVPLVDPNLWFVRMSIGDGKKATHTFTTAQILKMISEGTIKPTAQASHDAKDGFRSLATYKEFQGVALEMLTKKGADKNTARFRGIYKKIDAQEREREDQGKDSHVNDTQLSANTRYWLGIVLRIIPAGLGIILGICLLMYFAQVVESINSTVVVGVFFLASVIAWALYK